MLKIWVRSVRNGMNADRSVVKHLLRGRHLPVCAKEDPIMPAGERRQRAGCFPGDECAVWIDRRREGP